MTLIERLILGTARLAGGASEREALAIVRTALDAGVQHIDTAPSYGLGSAEAVVGKALAAFGGEVAVTAKLGSAHRDLPFAASVMRRVKRSLGASRADPLAAREAAPATLARPVGNDFRAAAMTSSLKRSLAALGRIDYLLLHDITAEEATPAEIAALSELASGEGAIPGHASLAQFDPALAAHFEPGAAAQCAISPELLLGSAPPAARGPLFLHSLAATAGYCRARYPAFASALERAARVAGPGPGDAPAIAAILALAATRAPDARLIVASSHRDRLAAVLGAVRRIDRDGLAPDIAAAFS